MKRQNAVSARDENASRQYDPVEMGWIRRSDLDTPSVVAWEMPDGKLFAAPRGIAVNIEVLSVEDVAALWKPDKCPRT